MGEQRTAFILLLILCSFLSIGNLKTVRADSTDYIRFASCGTIFSPLNRTYNSRFLTLNLSFGVGLGVDCSLNFSIDEKYEGPMRLVAKNPTELHVINEAIGLVTLPEMSEGSHNLTVNVLCGIYNYHGANPPGAPFAPTFPGSSDYIATWTHTIFFTIDTAIPEFPSYTSLLIGLVAVVVTFVYRQKVNKQRRSNGV
jgi:hypothetical protein